MLSLQRVELKCHVMSCRATNDGKNYFLGCTQDFERMFTVISDRPFRTFKETNSEESLTVRIYCGPSKDGAYKESVFLVI